MNLACQPSLQAARRSYGFLFSVRAPVRDGLAARATTASVRVLGTPVMPGIRFAEVRARVTMAEVLELLGFVPCERSGDQVRGPCPVHRSATPSGRSFSANLRLHIDKCFKCGSSGNHPDLYAAATGLSLFGAAVTLCEKLHEGIPWALDESPHRPRPADRLAPSRESGQTPG